MQKEKKLVLDHVKKVFPLAEGELEVIREVDLTIEEGEFISIVGASGCGKSTLVRMIAGLEPPTDGSIRVGERVVHAPSVEIGMIFQESRLFPWLNVEKNIAFGIHRKLDKKQEKELVQKYVDMVGLSGFERALPKQLSGGMQQRVSIARALINEPSVLLLDEPFGALDALTRIHMQTEVLDIWQKNRTTMILITHDIDEAIYLSDRILIMGKNPGAVRKEIKVELPRPRGRNSVEFIRIREEIYKEFFKNTEIELEYYI